MIGDVIADPARVRRRDLHEREAHSGGETPGRLARLVPPGDPAAGDQRDLVPREEETDLDHLASGERRFHLGENPLHPEIDQKDVEANATVDEPGALDEWDPDPAEDRVGRNAGPSAGRRGS